MRANSCENRESDGRHNEQVIYSTYNNACIVHGDHVEETGHEKHMNIID